MRNIADIIFSSFVLLVIVIGLVICDIAMSAEPSFCSIEYFASHQNKTNAPKSKRLISFQVGKLELNGLAVGGSDAAEVAGFSKAPASMKHCTWCLNSGNKEAERVFNHKHLPGPYLSWLPWISSDDIADDFELILNPELPKMLSCVEQYHYLASGCDGQRHRGPSQFAWFLAVAGCNPRTATDIANHFWALNGVPYKTRLRIAERGFNTGSANPEYRKRLQAVMK